jgi:DNA polymerase-3 subunit delta
MLYGERIDNRLIDQIIFGATSVDLDLFYHKLLSKSSVVKEIELILDKGEDEIRIITGLASYISMLFQFYLCAKVNGNVDSKLILGYKLPPQIEQSRAHLAIALKQSQYQTLFTLLQQSELSLKSETIDKTSLLLETLMKIKSLLH